MTKHEQNREKTSQAADQPKPSEQAAQKSAEQLKAEALRSIALQKNEKTSAAKSTTANNQKADNKSDKKAMPTNSTNKISKTAIFALLLALVAGGGVGGLYYWQTQQQAKFEQQLTQQLTQQFTQQLKNNKQQILADEQIQTQKLLIQQQQTLNEQFSQAFKQSNEQQQSKIDLLAQDIKQALDRKPSNWLVHESEYLIRVAVRSLWLERDARAAIALLQDADQRLSSLNDPQYLPARQAINQDIEQLTLLPKLTTDDTILALMGLNQQVSKLPFNKIAAIDSKEKKQAFKLSENASDWRKNLAKTWQKFLDDFITVRRRDGGVEPLMAPEYRQHLRENLSLKLQLAQWAASQGKAQLFAKTLLDVQHWHQQYFDMDNVANQKFNQRIADLTTAIVAVDYPHTLLSLNVISQLVNSSKANHRAQVEQKPAANTPIEKQKKVAPLPKDSPKTTAKKVEGSL